MTEQVWLRPNDLKGTWELKFKNDIYRIDITPPLNLSTIRMEFNKLGSIPSSSVVVYFENYVTPLNLIGGIGGSLEPYKIKQFIKQMHTIEITTKGLLKISIKPKPSGYCCFYKQHYYAKKIVSIVLD